MAGEPPPMIGYWTDAWGYVSAFANVGAYAPPLTDEERRMLTDEEACSLLVRLLLPCEMPGG